MRNRFVLSTRGGIVLGTLFIYAWTPGPSTPATVWQKCLNYCKIGVATVVMDLCVLCVCVLGGEHHQSRLFVNFVWGNGGGVVVQRNILQDTSITYQYLMLGCLILFGGLMDYVSTTIYILSVYIYSCQPPHTHKSFVSSPPEIFTPHSILWYIRVGAHCTEMFYKHTATAC